MFLRMVKELVEKEGITETLKAADQMEWVRQMNAVREIAMEIVNNDLIYNKCNIAVEESISTAIFSSLLSCIVHKNP